MVVYVNVIDEEGNPEQIEVDANTRAIVLKLNELNKKLGRIASRPWQ